MSQYVFFLKYEMKQNKPFSWNKNNYIHNNRTVSRAPPPLPAKINSPQIVLSAYRDDSKSIRLQPHGPTHDSGIKNFGCLQV